MNALTLIPGSLTLAQLRQVWQQPLQLTLDESAHQAINDSVACVEAIVAEGAPPTGSTPVLACWRRRVSPPTTWKICNVRLCCPMRRASASRWMTTLCV